jgi:hypothetical protein
MKNFPNGFASWQETHYEVVAAIIVAHAMHTHEIDHSELLEKTIKEKGHGGLYELAEDLTDEFETINKNREWDGEFFEEIETFLNEKL